MHAVSDLNLLHIDVASVLNDLRCSTDHRRCQEHPLRFQQLQLRHYVSIMRRLHYTIAELTFAYSCACKPGECKC